MSTRCQIKIIDGYGELWFYRHSDGYPSSVFPELRKLLTWVKDGKLRSNVEQMGGWIILLGAHEYEKSIPPSGDQISGWKVGAFEPCSCQDFHSDIEYFYVLDIQNQTLSFAEHRPWVDFHLDDGRTYG